MKPGTYVISPKFIKDKDRAQRHTRTVSVETVETLGTEDGNRRFARTVELTTSKMKGPNGEPLWRAGDVFLHELRKWKFVPVVPA